MTGHFDFKKVKKVMDVLNWGWAVDNPSTFGETAVPDLITIKKHARKLMKEAYDLSVKKGCGYTIGTGGFEAYCDAKNDYLSLKFILANWYDYNYDNEK